MIIEANNCYTIGKITTIDTGIYGSNKNSVSSNNSLVRGTISSAASWNDTDATNTIGIIISGYTNNWRNTTTNTHWTLYGFNYVTLIYDGNGNTSGSIIDIKSPYPSNAVITTLLNTFAKTGYRFLNWNTSANGTGTSYNPNSSLTISQNTTLYAIWTPNKASQIISFPQITNKIYGDASFSLNATSTSGLTISYTSSDTNVATISGLTVTIRGAGTCSITASQSGNINYNAATIVIQQLIVQKQSAKSLRDLGYSLNDLKLLKYTDYELLDAGFTINDLIPEIYSGTDSLKKAIPLEADRADSVESILKTQINTLGTTTTVFEQKIT